MKKLLLCLLSGSLLAPIPALAQAPGVNSPFNPMWSIPLDSIKRTYALGYTGLVAASAATDVWQICGSATATIRVTRIAIAGQATAVSPLEISIIKRSAANTGGTIESGAPFSGAAITGWNYDTNASAGTAKITAWTANPTVGAAVGTIASDQVYLGNATTGLGGDQLLLDFGNRPASAVVLRGTAQCLSINLNGTGPSGNLLDITTEWTEE